jgi:hypothetical protein
MDISHWATFWRFVDFCFVLPKFWSFIGLRLVEAADFGLQISLDGWSFKRPGSYQT